MAVLSFYFSLFTIAILWPSKKKVAVAVVEHHAKTSSSEIPSIDSPEFSKWIETPGNVDRLFA